ncbi:hypothetical protein STENM327S_07936 [Streptomyces tendae]
MARDCTMRPSSTPMPSRRSPSGGMLVTFIPELSAVP